MLIGEAKRINTASHLLTLKEEKMKAIQITTIMLIFSSYVCLGQGAAPAVWQDIEETTIQGKSDRSIVPESYRTLSLNVTALKEYLSQAPTEFTEEALNRDVVLELPLPDGTHQTFRVEYSPVMAPELAAKVPEIRTYIGTSIDGRSSLCRFSLTQKGFHAIILRPEGTVYIDPYSRSNKEFCISYFKRDYMMDSTLMGTFVCQVKDSEPVTNNPKGSTPTISARTHLVTAPVGTEIRKYRIAIAAVGEYTRYHSLPGPPDKLLGLAAVVATLNRINAVLTRDLSIMLELVPNNLNIIFEDYLTDPYDCITPPERKNQEVLDNPIYGIYPDYDIGHLFIGGGKPGLCGGLFGLSALGSICNPLYKGASASGLPHPDGPQFEFGWVAHELGHQLGARHTFNGYGGSNCNEASRYAQSAYEPGSGSTILAYAGSCSSINLQLQNDEYYHRISIDEIMALTTGNGTGYSCATKIPVTNNQPPTNIVVPGPFYIPKLTPFVLTGSATDPDNDDLTYCWEQFDLGPPEIAPNPPTGNAPIFRSYPPSFSPTRVFPKLENVLDNVSTLGERFPSYFRNLTFTLTVRDNKGGSDYATANLTVTYDGPFFVKYPCTQVVWPTGSLQTVHWEVANTNIAPISCTVVRILLSTDGGWTWPHILNNGTDNDGSEQIVVPNIQTTQARIKVEAHPSQNVFFAVSLRDFTIADSPTLVNVTVDQKYDDGIGNVSGGSFNRLEIGPNFTSYLPPRSFQFYVGSKEVLESTGAFRLSDQLNYKYRQWNNNLSDVVNFREFPIMPDPPPLTSYITPSFTTITLSNRLFEYDQDIYSNTTLEFRDPWYRDFNDPLYFNRARNRGMDVAVWHEHNTPFSFTDVAALGYQGLFMDQDFVQPNTPYYSLRARDDYYSLSIGQDFFDAKFFSWEVPPGSGAVSFQYPKALTTGVVFHSDNTTVVARYKGHLISNAPFSLSESLCATCPNSQRKLDWVENQYGVDYSPIGLYQLVYESAGKVWFTERPPGESPWGSERLVGEGFSPSIVTRPNGVYITFVNDGEVLVFKYENDTFLDISPVTNNATGYAKPVITCDEQTGMVFVVYEGTNNHLNYFLYENDLVISSGLIPGTGPFTARFPSVAQSGNSFHVAWEHIGAMYYMEIQVLPTTPPTVNFFTPEYLSNWWQTWVGAPSITVDFMGRPCVTWHAFDPQFGLMVIVSSKKFGGSWIPYATLTMPGADLWAPSIASFTNAPSYDLRIACNYSSQGVLVWRLVNGQWDVPGLLQEPNRLHANLTDHTPSDNALQAHSVLPAIFNGIARRIGFSSEHLTKTPTKSTLASSRELVLRKDTSYTRVRLGELQLQVGSSHTPLNWNTGYDTLVVGKTKSVEDYLRSETFAVPSTGILKYRVTNHRMGGNAMPTGTQLKLQIVDAHTNQVLATIGQMNPNSLAQGRQDARLTHPLNQLSGYVVYVRILLQGIDSTVQLRAIDYYHDPSTTLPKDNEENVSSWSPLPSTMILEQNHPNPFNRWTEVSFSLPDPSDVHLVVLNSLGKQIAVLTSGYLGAGKHTYRFDAGEHPSGVYIAKLLAGGKALSQKMTFIK